MDLSDEESAHLSSDPSTKGFDLSAGTKWIYPLNYQLREYQYNITRHALFANTLVCIPTGLGKTLIAAVVMYNFWRWYPRGKIVFLAPTKPLVAQQITACQNIMGIPKTDTIELTGMMHVKNRKIAWFTKRVIFATPQIFQNDIEKEIAPADLVRCVVIDEAHKAMGRHAYCESLRLLRMKNSCHRILALSATPGSKVEYVCQVVRNLYISHLELRDETSPDIIPYLNHRHLDIILVQLDPDLARFKEEYVSIIDRYIRILIQNNTLKGNVGTLSKGRIFYLFREFKSKPDKSGNHSLIMKTLSRCMSLYHAYELLIRHGLRAFTTFCQTHSDDYWMATEPALHTLLDNILSFLGPFPDMQSVSDGSIPEIPNNLVFGHTKFYKLKTLLKEHFETFTANNEDTRAIVFVEYRDSVNEVYVALLQLRPMLRPKIFVGQAGQKRKHQMQAMEAFRNNEANVLISTSVGEEGLDVGEVDLIVCFDISQSSPIRLVQRMGRTGRRRDGRIIMLVTDGKENQELQSSIAKKETLNKKVLHSSNIVSALYQESLRMVPPELKPVCCKIHIDTQSKTPAEQDKRKRKKVESNPPPKSKKQAISAKRDQGEVDKAKPTQSLMLQFIKRAATDEDLKKVAIEMPTQLQLSAQSTTHGAEPESVKLLTSDSAALEFLTLCAIKASKLEEVSNEWNRMDESYLVSPIPDKVDNLFDYPEPDLDIVNCLAFLEEPTESPTPLINRDIESDQVNDDVYISQHHQVNPVESVDINTSPAVGSFNYEDLFNDSSDSDKTIFLDNKQTANSDNNLLEPRGNEKRHNDKFNNAKLGMLHNEDDNSFAELLQDHYNQNSPPRDRALDRVLDNNKQLCEENNALNEGCFESILDESSDSDIPSSQGALEMSRFTRRTCSINARSEKQNQVNIERNANKTILPNNFVYDNPRGTSQTLVKSSETMANHMQGANSDRRQRESSRIDISNVNRSLNVKKSPYSKDKSHCCLPKVAAQSVNVVLGTDSSLPLSSVKCEEYRTSRISSPENRSSVTVENKESAIINKFKYEQNENVNKHFEELLDEEDNDVVFIGEITGITEYDESETKPIKESEPNKDSDEPMVIEEIRYVDGQKECGFNADSSTSTITQILDIIENGTPRRINLSSIQKKRKNLTEINESTSVNEPTNTRTKPNCSYYEENVPKDKSNNVNTVMSHYFNQENPIEISSNDTTIIDTVQSDLDLSDIKWEDEFTNDEVHVDCDKASAQVHAQSNEISLRTDCKQPIIDTQKTGLLKEKEESVQTKSNTSAIIMDTQVAKTLSKQIGDFDLGDYEWDSDFETPSNPVESLRQFSNAKTTTSANSTLKNDKVSGSVTSALATKFKQSNTFQSFAAPVKKKLGRNEKEASNPSTSKDYFDNDSDLDDDFLCKLDAKHNATTHRHPSTNYMLSTNRKPIISRELDLLPHEKENVELNSARISLSRFSAKQKNRDINRLPFAIKGAEQQKVSSLGYYSTREKKSRYRNMKSEFLDDEAEVTGSSSSGSSGEDEDLNGFISYTQVATEEVDMQGHYLQSIKNVHKPDAFHFRRYRDVIPDDEVFSQSAYQEEYLNDSFCVSGSEDDPLEATCKDSFLELAERALNTKKRKHSKNERTSVSKKRKLATTMSDSNSSEDETEKLRLQILEESMALKKN